MLPNLQLLGAALVTRPTFILIDEPAGNSVSSSALDPSPPHIWL